MYDLHCHLLPGIDDGPSDMEAAIALARQSVEDGCTHVVATPHIHHGRWDNTLIDIGHRCRKFRLILQQESIPLKLACAAEIRIGPEIMGLISKNAIPFLGKWQGKKVILLEMPHSHILPGTEQIIEWLIQQDIIPMIAHPERNKDVMRDIGKLDPIIDLGCLFQVTAGSVAGQFGDVAQERATELLEMGVVTILASDAHHIGRRPANLSVGRNVASRIVGAEAAEALVVHNPAEIARDLFSTRG